MEVADLVAKGQDNQHTHEINELKNLIQEVWHFSFSI